LKLWGIQLQGFNLSVVRLLTDSFNFAGLCGWAESTVISVNVTIAAIAVG